VDLLDAAESQELLDSFRDIISTSLAAHAGGDPAVILYELQNILMKAYIKERAYDKHLAFQLR
jgi:hypothetical protein